MESKPFYLSRTIQGQLVSLIGMLVIWLKLPVEGEEVTTGVASAFVLIGIIYSIIGRIKAKKELKLK